MRPRASLTSLLLLALVGLLSPSLAIGQEGAPPTEASSTETVAESVAGEATPPDLDSRDEDVPDLRRSAPQSADRPAVAEDEATLRVWNREIVVLRARFAGFEPRERASKAAQVITALPDEALTGEVWHEPTVIRGIPLQLVGVQNQVLIALNEKDIAPTSDQTLEELAEVVTGRVEDVLRAKAEQRSLPNLLRGIGLSLLATLILLALLWAMTRLRSRLDRKLTQALRERAVRVSGFDLRPYLRNVNRGVVTLAFWGLVLPLAYLWLTFVLKRFAYTRPWGNQLGEFLVDLLSELAIGALSAIPGLFTVFLIFLFTRFLTRIVSAFFVSVEKEAFHVSWLQPETAKATRRLVIVTMWLFALTVAYPYIPGSNTGAFKGVSVFVGLMISLGATGLINQIVSGMVIVYTRAFRPGEFVRIDETEGTVRDIGVLSTKISTLRKEHITIPNAVLVGTKVHNFSRDAAENGVVIGTSVTIGYDAPWRQIHALLKMAAARCSEIRTDPEPRVLQRGLSDFYVEYTLLANIAVPERQYVILSDLHGHIQDVFNEHDVQIMSPHYLDRAEEPVVVPKEKWTLPPAESD